MSEMVDEIHCDDCGAKLTWTTARHPCPSCGSSRRRYDVSPEGRPAYVRAEPEAGTDAAAIAIPDAQALTLFGVLYAIVATVVGVAIATTESGWWMLAYAVVGLSVLAACLLWFGRPIVVGMRWLVQRGQRPAPAPFGRRT